MGRKVRRPDSDGSAANANNGPAYVCICSNYLIILDSEGSESGPGPSGFDLQSQINSLQEQLAQFQLSSSTRPVTQRLYVPRERKIRSSSGQEGDLGVQEFVADIQSLFRVRSMSPEEQCDLILSHLEGSAHHEVRYLALNVRPCAA